MNQRKSNSSYTATLLASSAIFAVLTIPAAAQTNHICSTENVDRSIEIIQPAYGSAVCKVLYRKPDEGASDQVFWRSNQSMASCEKKAQELVASLTSEGFNCIAGNLYAQSPADGPAIMTESTPLVAQSGIQLPTAPVGTTNTASTPYQRFGGFTDAKWHLAGYADATFIVTDTGGETTTNFSAIHFNPVFHFQYKDLLLLEAETEITVDNDGETELELEYAQADLLLHDNATLVLGQFLSPVGQFQERLHPTWINRLGNMPAGFGHDGVQPANEIGAMLRGGISIGQSIATYSLAVGNGPSVSHEGSISFETSGNDNNSNKAVSGRIGFLPVPYFEIGGSFLVGDVTGLAKLEEGHGDEEEEEAEVEPMDDLLPTSSEVTLWGADAAYTRGPWDVRFEYLNATRDPINTAFEGSMGIEALPELKLEAWYAQIAYRLSGITSHKVLQRFEPVVRYGEFQVRGLGELAEEAAEERFDVGLNYWIAPSIVARGTAQWRDFTDRDEGEPSSANRYMLQFAYGF